MKIERIETANLCGELLKCGSACITEPYYSVELPHGGCEQSGIGRSCSRLDLEGHFGTRRMTTPRG